MGDFLTALRAEMDAIRADQQRGVDAPLEVYGVYALLENFNLVKYANSELAWTMNHNNLLPRWRM